MLALIADIVFHFLSFYLRLIAVDSVKLVIYFGTPNYFLLFFEYSFSLLEIAYSKHCSKLLLLGVFGNNSAILLYWFGVIEAEYFRLRSASSVIVTGLPTDFISFTAFAAFAMQIIFC